MTKQQDQIDIAVIKGSLQDIKEDIRGILNRLDEQDKKYLTKEEFNDKFDPYRRIIQGLVALVLTAVVTALMALVVKR